MVAAMAAQRQGKARPLAGDFNKSALHAECDNNRADDVSNARHLRCKRDELICLLCLKRTHHFIHAASAEGTYVRYATIATGMAKSADTAPFVSTEALIFCRAATYDAGSDTAIW